MQIHQNNQSSLTYIEKCFNIAGSIPIVGMAAGCIRAACGTAQFVYGGFICKIGIIGQVISPGSNSSIKVTRSGQDHSMHGGLNVARGVSEAAFAGILCAAGSFQFRDHPILFTGISLLPATLQFLSENGFEPRVKYLNESGQPQHA